LQLLDRSQLVGLTAETFKELVQLQDHWHQPIEHDQSLAGHSAFSTQSTKLSSTRFSVVFA